MAASSPHSTWPLEDERSSRSSSSSSPEGTTTRWRNRLGDPFNQLYRYALARLLVRGLVKTPVTPSQITVVQPMLAALAGYFVTFGDARHLVIAALLFEARALLGCVDVTLARAKNTVNPHGDAERTGARGLSAAFLYVSIAWHFHLHAAPSFALGAYLPAGVIGAMWMAAAIGLCGWLFARSPKLAVA
ncbi:MAG: hypothetical protein ABJE95_13485 [Byssovorax sp.]